jgi:hypothetical protein
MYGKLFASMYEGTLYGQWQGIITLQQLVILADADGVVDMTPPAIAARTSIPLDIIEAGLTQLSEADKYSRTPTEDGRRIVPVDPDRPWGWQIVNYRYYRDLASHEDKKAKDRERIAAKRLISNDVASCRNVSQVVADVAHTNTDTNTDTEDKKKTARKRATFVKPTVEQVAAYCRERGNSVAPAAFVNHYTANGWKVGKNPMKDWQAAVRTWETRDEKPSGTFGKPVFEQPHERRARELREFAERAEGGSGLDPPAPDVRRPVLEGVWERADRNLDRGD